MPMIWRVPSLMASGLTSGVIAIMATVAGSVARPAVIGDMPRVSGLWK